jgi:hypothetical protein
MEIINSAANLLGISSGLLIALIVGGVVLLGGWVILKTVARFTWRIFVSGCLLMVILIGGFFVGALLLKNVQ